METQPTQLNQRIIIVDALRGWALLGVVLMNYFDFFTLGRDWSTFKPDAIAKGLMYAQSFVFAAKSWTLLSVLFGFGFAIVMDSVAKKGHKPYLFFIRRMFWLFILAFINSALFFGDILKDYAFLGLIMILFYRSSAKATLISALVLFFALPFLHAYISSISGRGVDQLERLFPLYLSNDIIDVFHFGLEGTYVGQILSKPYLYTVHVAMLACMLFGSYLYKINFFNELNTRLKQVKKTFWVALALVVLALGISMLDKKFELTYTRFFNLTYWSVIGTMIVIASGICLLFLCGKLKRFFNALAFMGKMTLTNYMVQNLIGLLLFSGFGLKIWNSQPIWFYTLVAIMVFSLQVIFSKFWLSRYNYGPIEWIWRQLSYNKFLPIRKVRG